MKLEDYSTVKRWTSRLSPETATNNMFHLSKFIKWLKKSESKFKDYSPNELIEHQKQVLNGSQYELLDIIQDYVNSYESRGGYKKKIYSTMRSFFTHNRAELPKDPSFNIRGEIEKVRGTLTPEEIRNVVLGCKPVYQAIFISMLQGGMGLAEILYWNTHGLKSLKDQIRANPEVVKIDLPGRKKMRNARPYHTYIGYDAIEAIKNWLPHRSEKCDAIFTDQFERPITRIAIQQYWLRRFIQLGIIKPMNNGNTGNRYGKNVHELRDVFRTLWERSPAKGAAAEYFMGHTVDPLEYNKAYSNDEYSREQYLEALPFLQIMSGSEPFGKVDRSEMKQQERRIKELEAELENSLRSKDDTLRKMKERIDTQEKMLIKIYEQMNKQANQV